MTTPRLILLASPDEFLLELERSDTVAEWVRDHPDGELVTLDPVPAPARLVQELVNRSLFATERLVVVPTAATYLGSKEAERASGELLAGALEPLPLTDCSLLLCAVCGPPKGPLAALLESRGEVRFLPVPDAPKPWEKVRFSKSQRVVLERVISRVAPTVAGHSDVVDALCEAYGFHVRELAQAAERVATGGDLSPTAVRAIVGAGEVSLQQLEDAILERDRAAVARFFGVLAAGGVLVNWRGETIDDGGVGAVLSGTIHRLLRGALATRVHAARCDLTSELDPARCSAQYWYPRVYKPRLHERLSAEIANHDDSPLLGATQWQLHRMFRFAAAYQEEELIDAIARLARCGVERAPTRGAVPTLAPMLLALVGDAGAQTRGAGSPPVRRA